MLGYIKIYHNHHIQISCHLEISSSYPNINSYFVIHQLRPLRWGGGGGSYAIILYLSPLIMILKYRNMIEYLKIQWTFKISIYC